MKFGTILIADDAKVNRKILSSICKQIGHTTVEAENGLQALEILTSHDIDVLLLDIMMPEITGDKVLEIIKANAKLCHLPILIISSIDEMDTIIRCIEKGADDYLTKPFNRTLLQARIRTCLERKRSYDLEQLYREQLEEEQQRSESLLRVIFPDHIVDELKKTNRFNPRLFENVAVMFCDIAGFTSYCDKHPIIETVDYLQEIVETFENLAFKYELEKIKTIGDSFMAASGLLKSKDNPVLSCVRCGQEMLAALERLPPYWKARIGIDFGYVMGGVIGYKRYLFDIWGDTVNTAARMEHHGAIGAVNLSERAWEKIAHEFTGECLGEFAVKGKGNVKIYRVLAPVLQDGLIT